MLHYIYSFNYFYVMGLFGIWYKEFCNLVKRDDVIIHVVLVLLILGLIELFIVE